MFDLLDWLNRLFQSAKSCLSAGAKRLDRARILKRAGQSTPANPVNQQ